MKKYLIGMLFILLLVGGCAGCNDTQVSTEPAPPAEQALVTPVETSGRLGTVVTYSISVPKVNREGEAAETINRYFDLTADKLKDYAGELQIMANQEHCTASLTATYEITYQSDAVISVLRTVEEQTSLSDEVTRTHFAVTFDLESGGLLLASDLFSIQGEALGNRLIDELEALGAQGAAEQDALRARFDADRFYLTPTGYTVFYQRGDLPRGAEQFYEISYESLSDILTCKP